MKPTLKPQFEERMKLLLKDESDFKEYEKIIHKEPRRFIRCNTLKISPKKLMERLKKKWDATQPFPQFPEIMLINSELQPGELGKSIEHILGYYYIQEVSSMMSVLALNPKPKEFILDLAAAPGSKTTQIDAEIQNSGTLIANDINLGRIRILSSNLEKSGISNTIITRKDAIALCSRLSKAGYKFDKILLDAPCSGEGTLRSSSKTFLMWNPKIIQNLSRQQKKLIAFALKCLKAGGTLVYSTCTHAPEENEEIIDFALKNFPVKIESFSLPLRCRKGITSWKNSQYSREVQKTCRIYPQDNDSEGFFVAKLTLKDEIT